MFRSIHGTMLKKTHHQFLMVEHILNPPFAHGEKNKITPSLELSTWPPLSTAQIAPSLRLRPGSALGIRKPGGPGEFTTGDRQVSKRLRKPQKLIMLSYMMVLLWEKLSGIGKNYQVLGKKLSGIGKKTIRYWEKNDQVLAYMTNYRCFHIPHKLCWQSNKSFRAFGDGLPHWLPQVVNFPLGKSAKFSKSRV